MNPDDLLRSTSDAMVQMQRQMVALLREDQATNAGPGSGAFASFISPTEINSENIARIKQLPIADVGSPNEIWEEDGEGNNCTVHQIVKERG
jgi:hypothetical protein